MGSEGKHWYILWSAVSGLLPEHTNEDMCLVYQSARLLLPNMGSEKVPSSVEVVMGYARQRLSGDNALQKSVAGCLVLLPAGRQEQVKCVRVLFESILQKRDGLSIWAPL